MGEVYEVEDCELGVSVALKALRFDLAREPRALRSLKQEVLLARSITHPHVCRVYDLGRHGEEAAAVWFLTMELLRGETLSKRLKRQGRLSEKDALPLVEQMVAGLSAAHRAGVVHLDFKSGNVIVAVDDGGHGERAVVTDFGLARLAAEEASEVTGATPNPGFVGTPEYMSPEQVRGLKAGPAADIYALGVVLYELVTGRLPFAGRTPHESAERRLTEEPTPPRSVVTELEESWERVILRCLARDPADRFERAEKIVDELMGRAPVELEGGVAGGIQRVRFKLPEERDAFVGRQAELTDLEQRLASGTQLVTLLGAAGMGKTRLAVRFAWQSLSAWPGGGWFCDLTGARNLDGAVSAVASALGVPLGRADPVIQLGHAMAGRGRCLIILDTFEQVAEHAAATLGQWLERAPEARFVVTSRQRLKLPGEEIQVVEPLGTDVGVELFVDRVRRQRPRFDPEERELESVREVVELVEGMPLAIELAAARVRVMAVDQVLERMRERWRVLGGGGAGRHGSLLAAIDESWDLLHPWERMAWAQCSVFEGGFTLEAAEAVLDLGAWPEAGWVVDVLQALVDKSLLRMWTPEPEVMRETPAVRFGMYLSLQDYARKKLGEMKRNVEQDAEARHGTWYAAYGTEPALEVLEGHGGAGRRRELELELENLVSASRRGVARGDGPTATTAYCAACAVLQLRGPLAPAIDLGCSLLETNLEDDERARVLQALGDAERICGKMSDARGHLEAALTLARAAGNRLREGRIMLSLGTLNVAQGRIEEAQGDLAVALAALREAGDRRFEAAVLGTLGILSHRRGQLEEGRAHCEAALAIHRDLGNRRLESTTLGNLGTLHREQGRVEAARKHFEAALAIHRELGDRAYEGAVLGNLGSLYQEQGQVAEALEHYEAALVNLRDVGDRLTEGIILGNLGILHTEQGRMEEARTRFEAALAIARDLENRRFEGIVLGNLGNLHRAEGRAEAARIHYEAALANLRQLGDRRGEGIFLTSLGELHREQGRLASAREVIERGESLLRDVGDPIELGKLLCARAELERVMGDEVAARSTLNEAEELAVRGGAGLESELGKQLERARQGLMSE
jgi:predicted ATPase/Tfp pilus assembly protein PilF